ncbi:tRNA dihydrouridine synthase DusB [Sutterella wadsworthensis]|uniref:tRNA dihydrouridine synthase DusB n=1 Tax=Sutterella wadsworthensis TaxID=40545 RepID=UPI003A913B60
MKIGPHEFKFPLMLAPMAGYSDRPFREIVREWGADYAVAEMTASREDLRCRAKSLTRWVERDEPGLHVVQLLGADPVVMAEAAKAAEDDGADVVDINMGCPARKVLNTDCGSALMKNECLTAEILEAVRAAVEIPVTLKIRTGWDREHKNAPEIARIAEECGIAMLVIHGRTRADGFRGDAEYDTIARIKAERGIPVVANGDIVSGVKAQAVLRACGADGLMIGRGVVGRPWLFAEVRAALEGRARKPLENGAVLRHLLHHRAKHFDYYGARRGIVTFRKHLCAYLKPFSDPLELRPKLLRETDPQVQKALVEQFFSEIAPAH